MIKLASVALFLMASVLVYMDKGFDKGAYALGLAIYFQLLCMEKKVGK